MSGPIVRSAPNPKYSSNWDQVFAGAEKKPAPKKAAEKKPAKAKAKKSKKS